MKKKQPRKVAYIVWKGRTPGIYRTWAEVQRNTDGFKGSRFKDFTSMSEALMTWNLGFEEYEKGRAFIEKNKDVDERQPKKLRVVEPIIAERAKRIVAKGTGSNAFACTAASCTYPRCLCGT